MHLPWYSEGKPLPPLIPPSSEVKGLAHCQEHQVGLARAFKDVTAWWGNRDGRGSDNMLLCVLV